MPEPATQAGVVIGMKHLWGGLLAVVISYVGSVKWYFGRLVGRMDSHDERLDVLERNTVTSEDLDKTATRIEGAIKDMHIDVRERINKVENNSNKAHKRVDDLQMEVMKQK